MVRTSLGRWQCSRYNGNKCRIKDLCGEIHKIKERHDIKGSIERLRIAKEELPKLYNAEETYWAQRSCVR